MTLQFKLRSLLLLVALIGVSLAAARAWWTSRLEYLVDRHNTLMDVGRFAEARENARWALAVHPSSDLARLMVRQCKVAEQLTRSLPEGLPGCGGQYFPDNLDWVPH